MLYSAQHSTSMGATPQGTFEGEEDEAIQQLMAFMLADLETLLLEVTSDIADLVLAIC